LRVIAGYDIEGELGAGAMGVVLRARRRADGAPVALKTMTPDRTAPDVQVRFEREARLAATLDHPNLVRILGSGEEDGTLWLAMELLEGRDLGARLEAGPLPVAEVVAIGRAAAAGLACAHAAGIVHRDVKPSNLFLCADGRVKVLDFGLARGFADRDRTRVTATGVVVGTPAYMAVEQATGAGTEDARTDVWGLGATLYHALAGRPPFEAPGLLGQLIRIAHDPPDPLPPEVPAAFGPVFERAFQKDPGARFASVDDLAAALTAALQVSSGTGQVATAVRPAGPWSLADEVRLVSLVLADGLADPVLLTAAVEELDGVAHPLVGRRAVGVFGGEAWRGDEAERAVLAALAVRARAPGIRLAVATGRAVRQAAGAVTGAIVAAAGAVLSAEGVGVDAETARRVRGGFVLAEGRLVSRLPGRRPVGVRGPAGADLPIRGREPERALLEATLRQVIEERRAAAVALTGPPGIGKSRLRHELEVHALEAVPGLLVLAGGGEPATKVGAWRVLGQAVRQGLAIDEPATAELVHARLLSASPTRTCAEFLGEVLGARFEASAEVAAARADPFVLRDRITMAIGDWLEQAAARAPVLLVLEDVEHADAPSLEILDVLLRRLERAPLMVVATTAAEGAPALPAAFRRLALPGLSRVAIEGLVGDVLGRTGGGPGALSIDEIHERSGGNPLLAEELARAGREGRRQMPLGIEEVLQARLDALPRAEKDVLRRAAVFGVRFVPAGLAALGQGDVPALLARLEQRELVACESRGRRGEGSPWSFRSALVHEVAYASLTDEQRAELHARAADWLREVGGAPAAEQARHLDRAGDATRAAAAWQAAAEDAFRVGDGAAALEHSARALECGVAPADERRLRDLRVELLFFRGGREDQLAEIDALERLAQAPSDRALALRRRSRMLRNAGRYDDAQKAAAEGLSLRPDDVALHVAASSVAAESGRPAEGLAHAERALELAAADGTEADVAGALAAVAHCHALLGDIGAALGGYEAAQAAFERVGDVRRAAVARISIGNAALALGRVDAALGILEAARQACRAIGSRVYEGYALNTIGLALSAQGRFEEAQATQTEARAIARESANTRLDVGIALVRAVIFLRAGRPADAVAEIDDAERRVPEPLRGNVAAPLEAIAGAALLALGRREEARDRLRRALERRSAAGGMELFEAETFLAAHEAGLPEAVRQGAAALGDRARRIRDAETRRCFLEDVPAHRRLLELSSTAA